MRKVFRIVLALMPICGIVFAGGKSEATSSGSGNYPNKPVQIVVPFGPGGGTDVVVRTIMKYLDLGGQPMVAVNIGVEPKGGRRP